jgi:hypothetical protein
MSATFNPALPTDRDWVRADLGDTDPATAILSDAQINAVLAAELALPDGSRQTATWRCAAQAVAVIARDPVKLDAAGEQHDYSQRLAALLPLAAAWRTLEAERIAEAGATRRQPTVSVTGRAVW